MHPTVQEYRIPLLVTGVGLFVASILAFAPALMAESEAEVLTKKNASELQALTDSMESRTAELQQQMTELISAQASSISRLENQVSILNKATGRMHLTQSTVIKPATQVASEVAKLKTNAETRLTNLEKAITQMHQRQRALKTQVTAPDEPQAPDSTTLLRLTNLEKATKNLHLRSVAKNQVTSDTSIDELVDRLNSLENATTSVSPQLSTQLAMLERRLDSAPADQSSRLAKLEREILRLSQDRPQNSLTARYSQISRSSQNDIKRRVDTDIRLMRVERQLKRLESRVENFDDASREQELVVDQLFEMRGYIDTLLSEIYR